MSDGRKVRWLSIEIASTEETDGSLRPTIYRTPEAELFFALVGDLHPLLLRVSVESHPTRVVGGVDQVCLLGKPSPQGSGRTEPSPGSSRVTPWRARVSQSRPRSFSVQPWARRCATQALTMAAETTGSSGFTSMRSGQRLSMSGTAGRGAGEEVMRSFPSSAARSSGNGGSGSGAWAVRPGTASGIWERGGTLMSTRLFREDLFNIQQTVTVGRSMFVSLLLAWTGIH